MPSKIKPKIYFPLGIIYYLAQGRIGKKCSVKVIADSVNYLHAKQSVTVANISLAMRATAMLLDRKYMVC